MLNVAFRSEYFQYANPPYRAQMPAAKTVMTTACRCTPKAKSRRVPSNKHRKAVAPPITLKVKSTQLSIIAGHLTPMVPGAGVEPACRSYPARDFKSLVSTSFTTRAQVEIVSERNWERVLSPFE